MKSQNCEYNVLNPWAEAELQSLRGLSPSLEGLEGKTIGLLYNAKVSAKPILSVIEKELKNRFPTLKTSWYDARPHTLTGKHVGVEQEPEDRPRFKEWVSEVDAVIGAVGD